MEILRRPQLRPIDLPERPACAVTIGNFDGVHRGHQALLSQLKSTAAAHQLASAVVSFDPLPREFFLGERAPTRLSGLHEKAEQMRRAAIDTLCILRFDAALAQMPAEQFVKRVLLHGLNARQVLVGHDFRFGKDRAGDYGLLEAMGKRHHFAVAEMDPVLLGGQRVSSTAIRADLAEHDLAAAATMLGRSYNIIGRVRGGERLGRKLGFPTANIDMAGRRSPIQGVFSVTVTGAELDAHAGVANLGTRPAVNGSRPLLEVHLFDFDGDLYGQRLNVAFHHFLRAEQDFESLDALTAQMREDLRLAMQRLAADGLYGSSER